MLWVGIETTEHVTIGIKLREGERRKAGSIAISACDDWVCGVRIVGLRWGRERRGEAKTGGTVNENRRERGLEKVI